MDNDHQDNSNQHSPSPDMSRYEPSGQDQQQHQGPTFHQPQRTEPPHKPRSSGKPSADTLRKAKEFIIFMYMAIAALLGFRFVLSLLGANTQSAFVTFIYDVTYPPLLPFDGMFGRDLYRPSGYTLEFEILIALLVYAVVFYGFNRLIDILFD